MAEFDANGGMGVPEDESLTVCRREAKIILWLWIVQSLVMVGLFIVLGYDRTTDPLGFPFGIPSWYLFGGVIPAIVFLGFVIYLVRRHFTEVPLK